MLDKYRNVVDHEIIPSCTIVVLHMPNKAYSLFKICNICKIINAELITAVLWIMKLFHFVL